MLKPPATPTSPKAQSPSSAKGALVKTDGKKVYTQHLDSNGKHIKKACGPYNYYFIEQMEVFKTNEQQTGVKGSNTDYCRKIAEVWKTLTDE